MTVDEPVQVLLVEDHPVNRKVVSRMLGQLGCVVSTAMDGAEGVARARPGIGLVLMDCSMPVCDGFEATRRIRALEPPMSGVPIVALTAHATPADRARCLDAGMDDWITKPVVADVLSGVLERYTTWRRGTPARTYDGIIDPRVIEELGMLAGPDDPTFLADLVEDFRQAGSDALARARDHHTHARYAELRRTAHLLKGSGATVGAIRLREACARIEDAADAELQFGAGAWISVVEAEVHLASAALGAFLEAA